jgi:hypothetical protein
MVMLAGVPNPKDDLGKGKEGGDPESVEIIAHREMEPVMTRGERGSRGDEIGHTAVRIGGAAADLDPPISVLKGEVNLHSFRGASSGGVQNMGGDDAHGGLRGL